MRNRSKALLASATALALAGLSLVGVGPAVADIAPTGSNNPATVGSQSLPTAQLTGTGAIGWVTAISGNTVYVGGSFSGARAAGATTGSSTRGNVMSYNLTTGALNSFAPITNGQVRALAVSPDGTTVYIGGDFTTVNGTTRNRIAAIDATTGALKSWNPGANSTVRVIRATSSTVFFGGAFSSVSNTARSRAAAVSASTGALTAWAPTISAAVQSMALNEAAGKVAVGGFFNTIDGQTGAGFGIVDSTTGGTLYSTPIRSLVTDGSSSSAIWGMSSDGTNVYGSGYYSQQARDGSGNLEGTFAVNWASGRTVWLQDCHGDEYSNTVLGNVVYVLGHPHYCGNIDGGYPQLGMQVAQRAVAFTAAATGTVKQNTLLQPRYFDFTGQPAPSQLAWYPTLAPGTASGSSQAAWFVDSANGYVVMTGEFPTVNGGTQYGNARFALNSVVASNDGPQLSGSSFPVSIRSLTAGTVRVAWQANNDHDNETLTYTLYRGSTAVYTTTAKSRLWWERPTMSFTDTGVTAGASVSYHVVATDSNGNSAVGATSTATVPSSSASSYAKQIVADGATDYWRLGDTSGSDIADLAGAMPATTFGGVTLRTPGAISGDSDTAASFDGTPGTTIATNAVQYATDVFSVEAWFKTSSNVGGEIIGGGDAQTLTTTTRTNPMTGQTMQFTSDSSNHDREISTTSDGHLTFTVYPGSAQVVTSTKGGYNDGRWHHVVGSLSSSGQVLYVDGAQVASASGSTRAVANAEYWRIGGDSGYSVIDPTAPPGPPPAVSNYFTGSIDEPAVYVGKTLTGAQVLSHYTLGSGGSTPTNAAPTASFTASASGAQLSVDGSGSTDSDGTIASYQWAFGDGGTATGRTAQHAYASSGTYTVSLTVTDNGGATGTTTRSVSVTVPSSTTIASDAFGRSVSAGLGSADVGGAYTVNSTAKTSVSSGAARFGLTTGSTLTAMLSGVSSTSTDLSATASPSAVPNGGSILWSLIGRSAGGGDYRARVTIASGGQVSIATQRGSTVLRSATVSGLVITTGDSLRARIQVVGTGTTTIRAKVWKVGTTEPAAWQVTSTDTTAAQQTAGSLGLSLYLGSGSSISPLTVAIDDLQAVPVAG